MQLMSGLNRVQVPSVPVFGTTTKHSPSPGRCRKDNSIHRFSAVQSFLATSRSSEWITSPHYTPLPLCGYYASYLLEAVIISVYSLYFSSLSGVTTSILLYVVVVVVFQYYHVNNTHITNQLELKTGTKDRSSKNK